MNLLNACVANGIGKFLFTSTTSIYGKSLVDDNRAVWVNEELPVQPRDIYEITKQSCEELCLSSGSPFQTEDLIDLKQDASSVIVKYYPEALQLYERNHWTLPKSIDRDTALIKPYTCLIINLNSRLNIYFASSCQIEHLYKSGFLEVVLYYLAGIYSFSLLQLYDKKLSSI